MFKKDIFGNFLFFKRLFIFLVGVFTYPMFHWFNKIKIHGTEHLMKLKKQHVLFVSNHQTYFMDVVGMYSVFGSVKWKFKNSISNPVFLLNPMTNLYYVAAEETMKSGIIPKLLAYTGSVSIKRTWREAGKDVNKQVDLRDISNIGRALEDGWVITFPQGTTTPYVKGRRGTSHIIKKFKPVIIPVVVSGFRRTFAKKSIWMRSRGNQLSLTFKAPMDINYDEDSDKILAQIMDAIEQSEKFQNK